MRPVHGARHIAVLVPQQIARLLRIVATHRRTVPQRMKVRQPQLATFHVPQHVFAVVTDNQVAASIRLEEFRKRRQPVPAASTLKLFVRKDLFRRIIGSFSHT
jgi:hypothetical protein